MRKSPLSPSVGAGRRGGPSFLLSPKELASQVALSPDEARKRVANLALFSSVEELESAASREEELQTPRGLTTQEMRLLRETYEVREVLVSALCPSLFHS